jgi:hypothetical protein
MHETIWIVEFLRFFFSFNLFYYIYMVRCRSGAALRVVHRKALMEALAEELPNDTIRFSSKLTSIRSTEAHEGSSHVVLIEMEDGTTIKAKVRTINFPVHKMHTYVGT